MSLACILLAAGKAASANNPDPYCLTHIHGKRMVHYSTAVLHGHPEVDMIVEVLPPHLFGGKPRRGPGLLAIPGQGDRFHSVLEALRACPDGTNKVIIHEANRPLITRKRVDDLLLAMREAPAVVSLVKTDDNVVWYPREGIKKIIDKKEAYFIQTPQGYDYRELTEAYEALEAQGTYEPADYLAAYGEVFGLNSVLAIPGSIDNIGVHNKKGLDRVSSLIDTEEEEVMAYHSGPDETIGEF